MIRVADLHLADEAKQLGTGRRRVAIVAEGRKWVTVLEPGSLTRVRMARPAFDKALVRELDERTCRRYARRIREARRAFKKLGLAFPAATVRKVLS